MKSLERLREERDQEWQILARTVIRWFLKEWCIESTLDGSLGKIFEWTSIVIFCLDSFEETSIADHWLLFCHLLNGFLVELTCFQHIFNCFPFLQLNSWGFWWWLNFLMTFLPVLMGGLKTGRCPIYPGTGILSAGGTSWILFGCLWYWSWTLQLIACSFSSSFPRTD